MCLQAACVTKNLYHLMCIYFLLNILNIFFLRLREYSGDPVGAACQPKQLLQPMDLHAVRWSPPVRLPALLPVLSDAWVQHS